MKNRFWILLTVLVLTVSLLAITAFAADPRSAECEFCGETVEWTPFTTTDEITNKAGHYYLANNITMGAKTFTNTKICLDLNGKTLTTNRGFIVKENTTITIQGAGTIAGRGLTSNSAAIVNCAWVQSTGTLNMRNVTVAFDDMDRTPTTYGLFRVQGTMTAENCTITGGEAASMGGSMYIDPTGIVTLNNTTVDAGTAGEKGDCIYNSGKLTLKGSSEIENILMETLEADRLTFGADFTGGAELTLPKTVTAGDAVATLATGAATDNITCTNPGITLAASGTQLVAKVEYAAAVDGTKYATLTEALENLAEGQTLQLLAYAPELTLSNAVTLDLNGCSVGILNVNATVTVKDSATDDYSITDGIYGTITTVNGTVSPVAGYLQATEEGGISFHAYKMAIAGMTLRAAEAGIYFTTEFKGDSLAASLIDTFGVAMSVSGDPDESTLEKKGNFTSFDSTLFNGGTDVTSSVVCNVISQENGAYTNNRNADIKVYGRPYIKFKNGNVEMGQTKNRSFKQQVMLINDYKADLSWLNDTQKTELLAMYETYYELLDSWNATTIADGFQAEEDKTIKILAITSSFGKNTTQLLADIAMAEGVENIIVARLFCAACTLKQHVNYGLNHMPQYQYSKCVNGKWTTTEETVMLDGIQDEYWDIIYLQQSAAESALADTYKDYIDTLKNFVDLYKRNPNAKYIWNMTWAYQGDSTSDVFVNTFKGDQMAMYNSIVNAVQTKVLPRNDIDAINPAGTAIQNARTSYFGDTLTKDTLHLNTLGRVIAGYSLYATIMGMDDSGFRLSDIALTYANDRELPPITLSDSDKLVIKECVNNALDYPWQVTASQYPAS